MTTPPFPGPRPYSRKDRPVFFGRDLETRAVAARLLRERMTVLTGPSGAGKTSLLRAGVEGHLRDIRRSVDDPASRYHIGPVLVVRDWHLAVSPESVLAMGIRQAIERPSDIDDDYPLDPKLTIEQLMEAVSRAGDDADAVAIMKEICNVGGEPVLILDQLEEILGRDRRQTSKILGLVADLCEQEPRVHVLLSLREEFHGQLNGFRGLERVVGGLESRTYRLRPLAEPAAVAAFVAALETRKIAMSEKLVLRVLRWAGAAPNRKEAEFNPPPDEAAEVDLLSANAIFRELYDFSDGARTIGEPTVEKFREDKGGAGIRQAVLQRWIDQVFSTGNPSSVHRSVEGLEDDQLLALARRVAIRMAPYLSSSGYKTKAEEIDLVAKALQGEAAPLGVRSDALKGSIQVRESGPGARRRVLEVTGLPKGRLGDLVLSGPTRAGEWDRDRVVQALVTASDLALERLAEKYVVKSIGIPGEPQQWELVHDGLGEPLQSWAGGLKNTLSDALAGITVLRGQDLVLPGADEAEAVAANISLINWRGCWAGPDDGRSLLADVTFTSCILVGTLFADCDFKNVAFVDCDLDGSIFDRCSFETVRFEGGNAEGLTFRNSDMAGVTFEGSWLNHLGLREVELRGLVAFDDVEILAGTITGLSRSIESACVDLTNACVSYSWWDAASEALIRLGDNTANSSANVRLGPSA